MWALKSQASELARLGMKTDLFLWWRLSRCRSRWKFPSARCRHWTTNTSQAAWLSSTWKYMRTTRAPTLTCSARQWARHPGCSPASGWPPPGSPGHRRGLWAHHGRARPWSGTARRCAPCCPETTQDKLSIRTWARKHLASWKVAHYDASLQPPNQIESKQCWLNVTLKLQDIEVNQTVNSSRFGTWLFFMRGCKRTWPTLESFSSLKM